MKNTSSHQIECRGVCLSYDGVCVLHNITFELDRGDFLSVVGENGSGKSTLVKALLSLKSPSAGEIIFGEGMERGKIGYLPQQLGTEKEFPATVREIVLSGTLARNGRSPFYSTRSKKIASENMKKLGIEALAGKCFSNLSGGQRQRVLLARALSAAENMILLDEPTSGLDPFVTAELYELIEKLNKEEKMTVIMVSHDIDSALKYSNKILHLDRDANFFGTRDEYLASDVYGKRNGGERRE